jgi:hypothetical protein
VSKQRLSLEHIAMGVLYLSSYVPAGHDDIRTISKGDRHHFIVDHVSAKESKVYFIVLVSSPRRTAPILE